MLMMMCGVTLSNLMANSESDRVGRKCKIPPLKFKERKKREESLQVAGQPKKKIIFTVGRWPLNTLGLGTGRYTYLYIGFQFC